MDIDDAITTTDAHRRRVRRNRGLVVAVAAASVAVVIGVATSVDGQDPVEPPPSEQPNQVGQSNQPDSEGIFADFQGWIVYGGADGIWAVDPSRRTDQEPKLVIDRPGQPLGWSSDGMTLLIARSLDDEAGRDSNRRDLLVLDADGTETQVARGTHRLDGSISPDGTQVIYSDAWSGNAGIYTVGTDGGTPRPLLAAEHHEQQGTVFDRETYFPVFSPDGTQIAYFDGHGDWGHRLRVMNADGTGSRTLDELEGHIYGLAWSPDGERLLFSNDVATWVVGIDGSGPTQVVRGVNRFGVPDQGGAYPTWSPDGSQIAYHRSPFIGEGFAKLCTAQADGTQQACFTGARLSDPGMRWNPLPLEGGAE